MESSVLIEQARELRKNQTQAEANLWDYLRRNQLGGFKFRRQHPICGYILDFYCTKVHLGIELDGGVHLDPEQVKMDCKRTQDLQDYKINIIRFWNSEVLNDIDGVMERIKSEIEYRIHNKRPHP